MMKRGTSVAVNVFSSPFSTPNPDKEQYNLLAFRSHRNKIAARIQIKLSKGFLSSRRILGLPQYGGNDGFFRFFFDYYYLTS